MPESEDSADYAEIRKHLWDCYHELNKVRCPWDASEGKILKDMIIANPSWSTDDWLRMISNHFLSEGVNGDRPRMWLKNISRYARGPLDRFRNVKGTERDDYQSRREQEHQRAKEFIRAKQGGTAL